MTNVVKKKTTRFVLFHRGWALFVSVTLIEFQDVVFINVKEISVTY